MTPAQIVELVGYGADVSKTIADVVLSLIQGPEPRTLAELHEEIVKALAARKEAWMPAAMQDAHAAEQAAADAAFKG